jgi:AraC-like DNA-binding protein
MSAHPLVTASASVAGQGFLLMAILLSMGHSRPLANRLLAALIAVISMRMTVFHLLAQGISQPVLLGAVSQVFLFGGPLLYLYTRALIDPSFRLRRQQISHALLPLASAMVTPWLYDAHSLGDGYELGLNFFTQQTHALHKTIAVCVFTGYVVAALRAANAHETRILDRYSSIERATLRWLREILLLSLVIATTLIAWNMHVLISRTDQSLSAHIEFCGNALLFYLIATVGIRRHIQFGQKSSALADETEVTDEAEPVPACTAEAGAESGKARYDRTSLTDQRAQQLWLAVTTYMKNHEPYLDCDLSLAALSAAVDSYPRELSQVLNTVGQQNFYDFVNGYRALKARAIILSDKDSTPMIDIALAAGFTGRSTLYKHFSKCFAVTPSQFRKSCRSAPTLPSLAAAKLHHS